MPPACQRSANRCNMHAHCTLASRPTACPPTHRISALANTPPSPLSLRSSRGCSQRQGRPTGREQPGAWAACAPHSIGSAVGRRLVRLTTVWAQVAHLLVHSACPSQPGKIAPTVHPRIQSLGNCQGWTWQPQWCSSSETPSAGKGAAGPVACAPACAHAGRSWVAAAAAAKAAGDDTARSRRQPSCSGRQQGATLLLMLCSGSRQPTLSFHGSKRI